MAHHTRCRPALRAAEGPRHRARHRGLRSLSAGARRPPVRVGDEQLPTRRPRARGCARVRVQDVDHLGEAELRHRPVLPGADRAPAVRYARRRNRIEARVERQEEPVHAGLRRLDAGRERQEDPPREAGRGLRPVGSGEPSPTARDVRPAASPGVVWLGQRAAGHRRHTSPLPFSSPRRSREITPSMPPSPEPPTRCRSTRRMPYPMAERFSSVWRRIRMVAQRMDGCWFRRLCSTELATVVVEVRLDLRVAFGFPIGPPCLRHEAPSK